MRAATDADWPPIGSRESVAASMRHQAECRGARAPTDAEIDARYDALKVDERLWAGQWREEEQLPRDESAPSTSSSAWPRLGACAYHGIVGEFVMAADTYTEADRVAVLVTTLVGAGCAINRGPYVLAGNDRHTASLFAVIVGATHKGGKGTSFAVARETLRVADPAFMATRVLGGFGSGEAVVDAVRDPDDDNDEGAPDTRLLVLEPEFARMLKVASRDGSTLSMTIRNGWDGRPLEARSRARTSVASTHHLGVVGHITLEELRARLTDVETYSGFANRFLWVSARRSKRLPAGGNVPGEIAVMYGERLGETIRAARRVTRVHRTDAAEHRWAELYDLMADDEPAGLLGAVVGRDAPQCLRLSLLYALIDGSPVIDEEHVEAAWALWSYCRASAEFIFGDATGDDVADRLLAELRRVAPEGLDGTQQRDLFARHLSAARLERARERLHQAGLAETVTIPTGGRPRAVTYAEAGRRRRSSPAERSLFTQPTGWRMSHGVGRIAA
ncbi:MAG TPA: hypothetical protein VHF24_11650, partial [Acidimicrobiales bacterium]|nr:hypothetical protein [Acidimicrobiales bacterium]